MNDPHLAQPAPVLQHSEQEMSAIREQRLPTPEQTAARVAAINRDAQLLRAAREQETSQPISPEVAAILIALRPQQR